LKKIPPYSKDSPIVPAASPDWLKMQTLRVDRNGPVAEALAKKIIELAQQGERDPILLRQHAVQSVSQSETIEEDLANGLNGRPAAELFRLVVHRYTHQEWLIQNIVHCRF
jgi:hypothetical protein